MTSLQHSVENFETVIDEGGILHIYAKTPLAAFALKTWVETNPIACDGSIKVCFSWASENFYASYSTTPLKTVDNDH